MKHTRKLAPSTGIALAALVSLGLTAIQPAAWSADLQRHRKLVYRPLYPVAPDPAAAAAVDPGPASYHGYYGYYGTDISGVPYGGLYSASVVCLRSVPTANGYRTVYVC